MQAKAKASPPLFPFPSPSPPPGSARPVSAIITCRLQHFILLRLRLRPNGNWGRGVYPCSRHVVCRFARGEKSSCRGRVAPGPGEVSLGPKPSTHQAGQITMSALGRPSKRDSADRQPAPRTRETPRRSALHMMTGHPKDNAENDLAQPCLPLSRGVSFERLRYLMILHR